MLRRNWSLAGRFLDRSRKNRASQTPARKRRAFLEALEPRYVLHGELTSEILPPGAPTELTEPVAFINQGKLVVRTATGSEYDNTIIVKQDGEGNILITDILLPFNGTNIYGAELLEDQHTLKVPLDSIPSQQLHIFGGGGDDTLRVDMSGGNAILENGLFFYGGDQNSTDPGDQIILENGEVDSVDYTFVNDNDGSIAVDGRLLTYVGLEPVTDNLSASTRSFTFTGAAETIVISDPVAADGQTRINSTLGESVDFNVPTTSLTVITNGGDTVNINAFDSTFNTPLLSLQGTTSANAYNLGASNLIPDTTALSLTGNANFSLNGFSETIASLASTDTLPGVILATGTLTTGNATSTTFSGTISGNGGLTKVGTGTFSLTGTNTYTGVTAFSGGILNAATITDYGVAGALGARLAAQETNVGDGMGFVFRGGTLQYTGATPQSTNRQIRVQTTGATIDASGSVAAATLSFTYNTTNTNWFDTGGVRTLTLTGTNTGANTFSHIITDQSTNVTNVTKTGVGTWVLNNSLSTYSGVTAMEGGILNATSFANYGVASSVGARTAAQEVSTNIGFVFRSGTLQYTGSTPQSTNRQIRVQTTGGTIDASGSVATATLSFTYSATNTDFFDTGGTRTLRLGGTNTGSNLFAPQIIDQAGNATSLTKTGVGTWLVTNSLSNYTGVTAFEGGILNAATITDYGVLGSLGARLAGQETNVGDGIGFVFRGGTLQYTGSTAQTTNRQIRVQTTGATIDASGTVPTATLSFTYSAANTNWFDTPGVRTLRLGGTNTGNNIFANQIIDQTPNATNVTKTGAGTWFLTSTTSNYTGVTAFEGGILNAATITDYGVAGSLGARLAAQETNVGDGIGLVFRSGTLQYTGGIAQSTNRQMRVQTTGATIDASGSVPAATLSFTFNTTNTNWFDTGGTRTLTLTGSNTGANTYAQIITDQAASATSLTKTGTGSWTVSGVNTYLGATTVSAGTLRNGSATTFTSKGVLNMSGNGVFDVGGFNAAFTNVGASAATNLITNNGAAATFTESNQSSTISALITDGTGVLTFALSNPNSGVTPFTLNSPNTFSGGLVLLNNGGGTRLRITGLITTVGTPGAIVSSPFGRGAITVGTVATDRAQILFDSVANNTLVNNVIVNTALGTDQFGAFRLDTTGHTFSGTITANLARVKFSNVGSVTLTGQLTGPQGLDVLLTGGVTLNNQTASPNNYLGNTVVGVTGKLILGANNQIPNGATFGLTQIDGTLNLNGFSDTINGLTGQGIIDGVSGTPTLTIGDNNATGNDFGGTISNAAGTLALAKIGTGVQTISGTNTYSGATNVTAGTLQTGVNVPITNFSFETPVLGINTNSYNNATATWTFLLNSGLINGNGGGFNPAGLVNGNQNGFVQILGNFSQSITFASAGTYTLQFLTESRSSGGNPFNVRLDGTIVQASVLPASSASFNLVTIPGLVVSAGAHTLMFEGLTPVTDLTSFIDYVTISGSGAANAIPNSSVVTVAAGATLSLANSSETIGGLIGVAGSNVTLGSGNLTINNAAAANFAGVISGTGPVTKLGAGTQTLGGTNTYTGATTVTGGTLEVNGSVATSSAVTVQTGATISGTGTTSPLTVNAGGNQTPGILIGKLTTTGNYVQNGALAIQIATPSGSVAGTDYDQVAILGSGSVNIGAGATLAVTYTGTAGTFAPGSGQTYVIIDNDGSVPADTVGTFNGLPGGSTVTVDGKALTIQYNGGDGNDVVLIAPAAGIYVDDDFPATGTVDGDLETAGMQSATMGTNAFQSVAAALAAIPGYAGIITVNGGTYTAAALAGGGAVTLRLTQDLVNVGDLNVTFASLTGDATDSIVTRFNNTANANLIVQSGSFSGVISGSGDVVKSSAGTVVLSAANTYAGLTDVQAGILQITNGAALGTTVGATVVQSGAQLQLNAVTVTGETITINGTGGNSQGALNGLAGSSTWAGPVVIPASVNNRVGATGGTLNLTGVISGGLAGAGGGLNVRGDTTGVVVVSGGSNTYVGDTTVVVGTLRLAGGANRLPIGTKLALGNSASVSPAIVDLNGQNQTVAGLYSVTGANVTMQVTSTPAATLTVDLPTGTDTYGGVITGALALTKTNAGTLALTTLAGNNSNTYTGATTVANGRLHLSKTAGQNAIPGQLDITGGMVSFGANDQIADTATVTMSGAASILNGTGFNAGTLPGIQETFANLTVTGGAFATGANSNWNITGAASFTGGAGNTIFLGNSSTTIAFGGLTLTNMNATPGATVQTNNSFAIYGASPTIGTVTVGSGGLALNGSVFNLRKSATAGDAGSRLVLNGNVISTGTSSINLDAASGTIGISNVELSSTSAAATRTFDVTGTLAVSVPIANGAATPGSITKIGAGTLTLSGANVYGGATNANAGVLQLSGGAAVLDTAGAVNVGLGGTVQLLANETVSSYAGAGDLGAGTNDSTLALGAFTLTTTGNMALGNVTTSGGSLVSGGNIVDADDDNNITGAGMVLQAAAGVGTAVDPLETTLANLEASGGTGGVFVANTGNLVIGGVSALVGVSATASNVSVSASGSLTVNETVSTTGSGNVTLSTVDAAGAGQDIVLTAAVNVNSAGAIVLNAGDNATLAGSLLSGTTATVNVDAASADAGVGGVFSLTGTITAPGGAVINGNGDNDTFNLAPQAGAAVTVNGLAPDMTLVGDVLNLDLSATTSRQLTLGSIGAGVWTLNAPLKTVSYTSIEAMNSNTPFDLSLDANLAAFGNTGVPDLITVRQNGANLVVERTGSAAVPDNDDVGVIFQGASAQIQSFTYAGSADADVLTVSDVGGLPVFAGTAPSVPDNVNLAGVGSILFDGNGGADEIVFALTGASGGLSYAIGNGSGPGSGEGEVRAVSGAQTLQAYFVDVEQATRTGTNASPGTLNLIGDAAINAISIGATGATTTIGATGYTPLVFSGNNFNNISIDGGANADVLELASFGSGQTNNPTVTLSGGIGDDTLRVLSTSGNTGIVTLLGGVGSDSFVLQSAVGGPDEDITAPVIVDGTDGSIASNNDTLTIIDTADASGDTVFVNATSAGTSSDYRVEGVNAAAGDDVIFRNIDTLTYTGTTGNDAIDAQFTNTTPAHDLSIVTLNGWLGADQFLLFTSDQQGGTGPTPTATASGVATIALNGDAPGNPNALDGNDVFGATAPGLTGTGAGNAGLVVADSVRGIRPSASTAISINGGQPTAPVGTIGDSVGDVLNLDLSGVPTASSFVLATLSGVIASPGLQPLNYGQIEDLNFITNHQLLNLQLGDTLVRGTSGQDTIIFSKNPTPADPSGTRVRLNTLVVDFPMSGKTLTYAGDANDYVTHSNVTFPMEIHGEGGDDMLFGGMGNDLIYGGLGNDQVNASGGDNIVVGDEELIGTLPLTQDSTIGGNDVLSALGGNDVFYGGGGNDQVSPGAGNDYLHGGEGDDILDGAQGDDRIYGGGGNDVLSGSAGNDLVVGGEGNDRLIGGEGNDVLIGGGGADILNGNGGDDLVISGRVANEASSWDSQTPTTTFGSGLYSRPTDNDAALLVLLTQWSTAGDRSTLAAISSDAIFDQVWGDTGNDDFSVSAGEAQDFNANGMGLDELI